MEAMQSKVRKMSERTKLTQAEMIIWLLRHNKFVSTNDFHKAYIPEFRSRISKLKKKGYRIEKMKDDNSSGYLYYLVK